MNDTDQRMRDIGQAVNERVPDGFGFMVIVWSLNDKTQYIHATNDEPKAKEILTRAGISNACGHRAGQSAAARIQMIQNCARQRVSQRPCFLIDVQGPCTEAISAE